MLTPARLCRPVGKGRYESWQAGQPAGWPTRAHPCTCKASCIHACTSLLAHARRTPLQAHIRAIKNSKNKNKKKSIKSSKKKKRNGNKGNWMLIMMTPVLVSHLWELFQAKQIWAGCSDRPASLTFPWVMLASGFHSHLPATVIGIFWCSTTLDGLMS